MSDERPQDQDDEENDEFYSARETQRRLATDRAAASPPPLRSDRESPPPPHRRGTYAESPRQQNFFSDEKAMHSDKSGKRRANKWDRRNYKKEELDAASPRKASKPRIKPKHFSTEEASKTDEETTLGATGTGGDQTRDAQSPMARAYFQQSQIMMSSRIERPIAPKCRFQMLHFAPTMELVEFDGVGDQMQHDKYPQRAITNPWRRWGAHRALCDQGGYMQGPKNTTIKIDKGSPIPPIPPDPLQITLNKNSDIPNSQCLFGTIRVLPGPALPESHRIGRVIEEYVHRGGYVPKPAVIKHFEVSKHRGGTPVATAQKGKQKKKTKKKKKKKDKAGAASSSTDSSDTAEEENGSAEKVGKKAKDQSKIKDQHEQKDDSKKGGGGGMFSLFFRRAAKSPRRQQKSPAKDPRKKPRKKT